MPVLNLNEDERNTVIAALHHERVRLTGEWSKAFDDEEGSGFHRDSELERLSKAIDLSSDLRRKIEVAVDITKAAWHNEYGWLHSKKVVEVAKAAIEAGDLTREDVAETMGFDLEEIDAANARDRARLRPFDPGFYEQCLREVAANVLGEGVAQDQIAPGSWITLPDGYEVDADPFEITDPEDPVNAALFSSFNAREYDRIEIGVNGDIRSRYTVRKEDLENFLRDIHERFSDRY